MLKHLFDCFRRYRGLGSGYLVSAYSAGLKMPLHKLIFDNSRNIHRIFLTQKFKYSDGVWLTFHFGLNHYRPLLTNDVLYYVRGENVANVEKITPKNIKYIYLDEHTRLPILLNKIKNINKILVSVDGSVGRHDVLLDISGVKFSFSSAFIRIAQLLKKPIYFELYYVDHFLKVKRKYVKVTENDYKSKITILYASILKRYPHNLRLYRANNG